MRSSERFALREFADAVGQVLVRVARVAGEELADPRQHVAKVPAVDRLERLPRGRRELEHGDAAAGRADARHLGQAAVGVGDVAQAERDAHDLERVARQRQRLGVGFDERDPRRRRRP